MDPSELESLSQAEIQERYETARKAASLASSGGSLGTGNAVDREELSTLREELSRRRDGGGSKGNKRGKGGDGEKGDRYKF